MEGKEATVDALAKAVDTGKGSIRRIFAREYVVCDGPREGVKLVSFLKPKPGVTRKQVCEHYLGKHAHDAKKAFELAGLEGKVRYTVNVMLVRSPGPRRCPSGAASPRSTYRT